jgi:hypothetical protein
MRWIVVNIGSRCDPTSNLAALTQRALGKNTAADATPSREMIEAAPLGGVTAAGFRHVLGWLRTTEHSQSAL